MREAGTRRVGLARLLGRWRPDRNPLRRAADRIEGVMLAALAVGFLAGAPLAAVAGAHWAGAATARAERAQVSWHLTPATLLRGAPPTAHALGQASLDPRVPARWQAPDGTWHGGVVYAPPGARAGTSEMVWTDASGRLTPAPLGHLDVILRMAVVATLAVLLTAAGLVMLGLVGHVFLERRRMAAWGIGWVVAEREWTGRT